MHPSLRGYTTAVLGDSAGEPTGARVADEVNAVHHLVSRTNDLAVALTDFAVPLPARLAVLRELLGTRVDPIVLRLVLRAVQTERPEELPTVLHELYEFSRHLHEFGPDELRAEEPRMSRTAWREYAAGFAAAVFEGIEETAEIEEIEDELFRLTRIVESSPALRSALSDPSSPPAARQTLLGELIRGKVRPATMRLVAVLLEGHVRDLVASMDWLVEQAAQARGWRVARVRAARPIDEDEQRGLTTAMEHLTNQPVELQVTVDAELLGGAVIQIGNLLVDASARHRLEQLHEHLLGTEGTTRGALN
ncbi:MAG TPA: ATP synthase F1 subunit delta [Acidimicrobiales bacterium]|nr:ATP synthase F1 subunit delta [Acidimicrobiales bacterium]